MRTENIKLNHIGFAVKDINKAIEWYGKILGFNKLVPPGICKMDLMGHKGYRCIIQNNNGDRLELEQRLDVDFPDNKAPIISHISLEVDDIEEMQRMLKEYNVIGDKDSLIVKKTDISILYFNGLDGIRIELIQKMQ